jgi:glucose dehydrogenase
VLQALSVTGFRVGNFAPDRPWNYLAYGLAAPYVAWLVWRRRPRARFAAYVFLTHEAVRGVHFHRWDAVAIAALWVLLLQLPSARRWMPSLRPAEMRARWRRQLTGDRQAAPEPEPSERPAPRGDSPPGP